MLREITRVRQIAGEPPRRWFNSASLDLIVWLPRPDAPLDNALGFQLCYDKRRQERSLIWQAPATYRHCRVDDGEGRAFRAKATPVLHNDPHFPAAQVLASFLAASEALPDALVTLVSNKLRAYPRQDISL